MDRFKLQHRIDLRPRPPSLENGLGMARLIQRVCEKKLASADAAATRCTCLGYEIEEDATVFAIRYELAVSGNNNDRSRALLLEKSEAFRKLVDDIAAEDGRARVEWPSFDADVRNVWKALSPGGVS